MRGCGGHLFQRGMVAGAAQGQQGARALEGGHRHAPRPCWQGVHMCNSFLHMGSATGRRSGITATSEGAEQQHLRRFRNVRQAHRTILGPCWTRTEHALTMC